jgi:hypothetical protein
MLTALQDLKLDELWILYPGDQAYQLDDRISVVPISLMLDLRARIF